MIATLDPVCPVCALLLCRTNDGRWWHPYKLGCPHEDDWLSWMDIDRLQKGLGLELEDED